MLFTQTQRRGRLSSTSDQLSTDPRSTPSHIRSNLCIGVDASCTCHFYADSLGMKDISSLVLPSIVRSVLLSLSSIIPLALLVFIFILVVWDVWIDRLPVVCEYVWVLLLRYALTSATFESTGLTLATFLHEPCVDFSALHFFHKGSFRAFVCTYLRSCLFDASSHILFWLHFVLSSLIVYLWSVGVAFW